MKKFALLLATLCTSALLLGSCNSEKPADTSATAPAAAPASPDQSAQPAGQPAPAAVRYECPMNDGGQSSAPGQCPKCGMDLVKKA